MKNNENRLSSILEKCTRIIESKNGKLLSKKFNSLKSRFRIQCADGHIFTLG